MTRRTASWRPSRPARRALTAVVIIGLTTASSLVLPAAAEDEISINPDQVVRAEPGSVVTVAEQAVPAELVGRTCDLRITTDNGSSVHPGNAVVSKTGDSVVETTGVEDGSEASVVDVQPVVLGETLTIQLRMGDEGLSSLGFTVAVDCEDLVQVDPPAAEQTTDPAPTTTVPVTSLPEAPPAVAQIGDPTFTG